MGEKKDTMLRMSQKKKKKQIKHLVADNSILLSIYFKTPCIINIMFKVGPSSLLNSEPPYFSELLLTMDSQPKQWA